MDSRTHRWGRWNRVVRDLVVVRVLCAVVVHASQAHHLGRRRSWAESSFLGFLSTMGPGCLTRLEVYVVIFPISSQITALRCSIWTLLPLSWRLIGWRFLRQGTPRMPPKLGYRVASRF